MKRITRDRFLTAEEAIRYTAIREGCEQEKPEIHVESRVQQGKRTSSCKFSGTASHLLSVLAGLPELSGPLDWANGKVYEWLDLMDAEDCTAAAELMVAAIREHCRRVYEFETSTAGRFHFSIRVVLNGLGDLANSRIMVGDDR
jgi:hypothetical protein